MQRPEFSMHQNFYFNLPQMGHHEIVVVANAQVCLVPGRTRSAVCDNTLSCGFVLGAVLLHSIKQVISDVGQVIQLLWLLAPLACWAPLAFGHGFCRQQWTRHFR